MNAYRNIPWSAWRVLCHSVIFGVGMSFFDVLFSFYLVSMGFGVEAAGIMSTTARMAGLAFGIPAGLIIDKIGAKQALIIGVIGYIIGMMVLLFMPNLILLIVSQFVAGCMIAVGMSALMPLLTLATPPAQRTLVFGLNEASISMGLIGSIVAGWVPSLLAPTLGVTAQDALAYRSTLLIGCVIMLFAILPVLRGVTTQPSVNAQGEITDAHPEEDHIPMKSNRKIIGYATASIFVGLAAGTFLPFQSLYFRIQQGMPDQQVGFVLAGATVMMGLGAMLAGRWLGQGDMRKYAAILRFITAPVFACLIVPQLSFALVGFLGRAFFMGGSFTLNDVLTMHLVNAKQRGRLASLMTMFWSMGWGISSTLSGYLQQSIGFAPLIAMSAVAYVCSGLAIWFLAKE